jgi:preprotein translocase subunit SecF
MLVALGIIMVYIAVRFQFKFSVGAVVALAHDVIITLGIFSIFGIEFNLNTLAAMLAIIGYSLNDTIVVSDRIRENFRRMRKGSPIEMGNTSLNQTLSRTIITSFTTLLVLFSVLFIGGETTPIINATAKPCVVSPPINSTEKSTNKVVNEVIMVRLNV